MPNVMATQQNRDGALCKSTVIPFIVAPCNFWQTPAARVPCSNAANIGECRTWTHRKKEKRKKKIENTAAKYNVRICYAGRLSLGMYRIPVVSGHLSLSGSGSSSWQSRNRIMKLNNFTLQEITSSNMKFVTPLWLKPTGTARARRSGLTK